jgi:HEAT repeat protein
MQLVGTGRRFGCLDNVALAARELGRDGVLAVAELLKHDDLEKRRLAAYTLSRCGSDVTPAVPHLLDAIETDDEPLAGFSLFAFANADAEDRPTIWGKLMQRFDAKPTWCWHIFTFADEVAPDDASIVEFCSRALDKAFDRPRVAVVELLGRSGDGNQPLPEPVVESTYDTSEIVRMSAINALERLGVRAMPALSHVEAAVHDPCEVVRLDAVRALWAISGDLAIVQSALTEIIERIDLDNDYSRFLLLHLFERLGPAAAPAVPWLATLLAQVEEESELRYLAAEALCAIAPAGGQQAIDLLIGLVGDTDLRVTDAAAKGLAKHGAAAVEPLSRLVREGNDRTREWAMVALAQSGAQAADAAGTLTDAMQVQVDRIRWWAAIALAEISGDPATVPVLIECLEQGGAYMQYRAAKAVGAVGQAARPAIRPLKRLRRHRAFTVRDAAAEALERIAAAR